MRKSTNKYVIHYQEGSLCYFTVKVKINLTDYHPRTKYNTQRESDKRTFQQHGGQGANMFAENAGRAECVPHKNKYLQVRTEVSVSKVVLKL